MSLLQSEVASEQQGVRDVLRKFFLVVATVAVAWPVIVVSIIFLNMRRALADEGYVSGQAIGNSLMMLVPSAFGLSLLAFVLGILAYSRTPKPRPRRRAFEALLFLILALLWAASVPGAFMWVTRGQV